MKPEIAKSDRNAALDFVKGVLILLMVVYHWGNYFLGNLPAFYEILRFLTPSFILITGVIVSMIYGTRYAADYSKAAKRLALRGLKLIAVFSVLNIAIHALALHRHRAGNVGLDGFISNWFDIYVSGNSYLSSFRVLLPIGYLLLISIGYLYLSARHHLWVVWGTAIIAVLIQSAEFAGSTSVNLSLLSFGLIGLAMENIGFDRLNAVADKVLFTAVGYVLSVILMLIFGPLYLVQLAEVSFALLFIYGIGRQVSTSGMLGKNLILLGKYSLFAYIFQIGVLQILASACKTFPPNKVYPPLILGIALFLTVFSALIIERLRRVSKACDSIYRVIFA